MIVQVASRKAEEGNATTSSNWRGREMGGRENYKQEKSTGTEQILGMMEGLYSGGRYLGE